MTHTTSAIPQASVSFPTANEVPESVADLLP